MYPALFSMGLLKIKCLELFVERFSRKVSHLIDSLLWVDFVKEFPKSYPERKTDGTAK